MVTMKRCVILLGISMSAVAARADCTPVGAVLKGAVNQGGYHFEYESREGPNCREYRMRNKPGQPLTPVKWVHDGAVFIDANLPACPRNSQCEWITAVQQSVIRNRLPTQIGFGINKDEYVAKPITLVEARFVAATPLPGGSTYAALEGVVTDASGKPAAFEFSLRAAEANGAWLIDYTATQEPANAGSADPIVIRWGTDTETFYVNAVAPGETRMARFELADANVGCGDRGTVTATQGGRLIARTSAPAPCQIQQ